MCGIVAYIGHKPARNLLLEGLKRLEYRGYDSAGDTDCLTSLTLPTPYRVANKHLSRRFFLC